MKNWKAWAWMTVIFISGAAVGSGGTMLYTEMHFRKIMERPPKEMRRDLFDRLAEELELTEEQRLKVRPIMDKGFEQGHLIMESVKPRMDAIMDKTKEELRPILTAEQMEKFEAFTKRFKDRRHPPPPPGQGPPGQASPGQGPPGRTPPPPPPAE